MLLNKQWVVLFLSSLILIIGGCASQRQLVNNIPQNQLDHPQAMSHFLEGVFFDIEHNYGAALLAYHEALLYDSSAATIYFSLGRNYLRLGKEESAAKMLEKCLQLNPNHFQAKTLLANLYAKWGRIQKAEQYFKEILARDSSNLNTYYNLALLYLQKDQKEKAAGMYEKILNYQEFVNPQIILGLAEIYLELNDFKKSAATYEKLIENDPQEPLGYYGLAFSQEVLQDTVSAIENYRMALQLQDDLKEARERLANLFMQQKKYDAALDLYQSAIANDSTHLNYWLQISEIYRNQNDTSRTIATLQAIKERFPKDWRGYLNLGRLYLDLAYDVKAYHEFKQVIQLKPDIVWGWLFMGYTQMNLDSLKASKTVLEQALEVSPDEPLANYYLGLVLNQMNRDAAAIPYFEKALSLRPNWVRVLSLLASIYEEQKVYHMSDSLFRKAIRIEPDNATLLNNYGYSLSVRGIHLNEALEMAKRALKTDEQNGAYLDTVGWIFYQLGDYDKALEYLLKAYEVFGENAVVVEHLGDVYLKLGMHEKARIFYEKALELDKDNQQIREKLGKNSEAVID